ncbi:hypothetical protein Lal_00012631 [Lupinus albus]|nr:hypothetical protein Lal_00012631 [Lupinus albus]
MKSVVHARNNNIKLTVEWNAKGQPLNNKGGNKLVCYIGVMVRQNVSIKFKHWSDERLNVVKDIIWKDIIVTVDVDEQHKDYIMKSYVFAARTKRDTFAFECRRRTRCFVGGARKNKQGVINNEKVQEVVNRVVTLKEWESFRTVDSQVILEKALGLRQYTDCIRGAGFEASKQFLTPSGKCATKVDVAS